LVRVEGPDSCPDARAVLVTDATATWTRRGGSFTNVLETAVVTPADPPEGEEYVLQRLRALRKNESGFTLTELLIVIVILGILTGVVIIAVGAFQDRGESAACRADKKTVETAVEAYRAKNSGYPASLTTLVPDYLRSVPNSDKYQIQYVPPPGNAQNPAGTVRAQLVGGGAC
jgi:prepilin-type N-terminal cleavage/methylation domain-containing protein